jgi:hypothetical protein
MHSAAAFATSRYSASTLDLETVRCRFDDQEAMESLRNTQNLDVEQCVAGQPPQSAPEYTVTSSVAEARSRSPCDIVPRT